MDSEVPGPAYVVVVAYEGEEEDLVAFVHTTREEALERLLFIKDRSDKAILRLFKLGAELRVDLQDVLVTPEPVVEKRFVITGEVGKIGPKKTSQGHEKEEQASPVPAPIKKKTNRRK